MIERICACADWSEAGMVTILLQNEGFHPMDLRPGVHASMMGGDLFYYVEVPAHESEPAREFLKENGYEDVLVGG